MAQLKQIMLVKHKISLDMDAFFAIYYNDKGYNECRNQFFIFTRHFVESMAATIFHLYVYDYDVHLTLCIIHI